MIQNHQNSHRGVLQANISHVTKQSSEPSPGALTEVSYPQSQHTGMEEESCALPQFQPLQLSCCSNRQQYSIVKFRKRHLLSSVVNNSRHLLQQYQQQH